MLYSLLYVVIRFLLEVLIVRGRSEGRLRAEVLALRHQLAVLERQVGRPFWQPSDRLVLAGEPPWLSWRLGRLDLRGDDRLALTMVVEAVDPPEQVPLRGPTGRGLGGRNCDVGGSYPTLVSSPPSRLDGGA